MKKIFYALIFIFSVSFLFAGTAEAGSCLKFNGTVAASGNFPSGGSVRVSCEGDNPPGPSGCVGSEATVKPGENFSLNNCSCLVDECLHVEVVNAPSCTTGDHRKYCGTNSNTAISAPIKVSCPAPEPTGPKGVCEPDDTRTSPSCQRCDENGQWQKDYSVGDWMTCKCQDNPSAPECQAPTATPGPKGVCEPDDTRTSPSCQRCDENGQWQKDYSAGDWQKCFCTDHPDDTSCQPGSPPPTPTATPPGGGGTPTATPPGGGGTPTATPPGGGGTPTATPPPTPTPTPEFNKDMCKCDGFQNSPILAGQNATFTAFAKVEGDNVSKARVVDMKFWLIEEKGGVSKKVGEPEVIAAQIAEESPNKVRYKADWTKKIPQNADAGTAYKVFADLNCKPKTQANAGTQAVLAAEDTNATPSFFGQILNTIKSWFGISDSQNTAQTQGAQESEEEASILQEQIRLGQVKPANVTQRICNGLYFEFPSVESE